MNSKQLFCLTLLLAFLCNVYCQENEENNNDESTITIEALTSYNKWRNSNKRVYLNDEEKNFRQIVFFENLRKVKKHNANQNNTYEIGLNQFSDMTQEEFVSRILNVQAVPSAEKQQEQNAQTYAVGSLFNLLNNTSNTATVTASVDWRLKGAVSSVKNQGSCGSCWSFSTAALMESYNFIKNGKLQDFSEQQLVDCVTQSNGFYSFGCNGGNPFEALYYATKYGIMLESQYPYLGIQKTCKVTSPTTGYYPKAIKSVPNTVADLKNALNSSPVAVVVDATFWGSYVSGIFNGCGTNLSLNHAVLVVGYDTNGNWIIKNSWSPYWGEKGYMRLAAGNTCGIISYNQIITA